MKIACYTDIHNQQIMLNYPTVLRKSAGKTGDERQGTVLERQGTRKTGDGSMSFFLS